MTVFGAGDRVRVESIGDDGLPMVRYGFVGGVAGRDGPVIVMLDGELGGDVMDPGELQHVAVTTIELRLQGSDLVDEPALRIGLVALWEAEADRAGLEVDALHPMGDGVRDSNDSWALAEMTSGGEHYVVRAVLLPHEPDVVRVRADRPGRYDLM
jgi:hypothetical protein